MIDMRPREAHGRTQVTMKQSTRDRLNRFVLTLSNEVGYKVSQDTAILWLLNHQEETEGKALVKSGDAS